jgi:hypothetical protein
MASELNVLIACEYTGAMRRAFRALGHNAWSCDLLPAADGAEHHLQEDARTACLRPPRSVGDYWDLIIAHPPCTFLCNSGVRWLYGGKGTTRDPIRWRQMQKGAEFFKWLLERPACQYIAVENPVMHVYARDIIGRGATQIVQPWHFGDPAFKATGWWLKGLPVLTPTNKLRPPKPGTEEHKRWSKVHRAPPGPDRWKDRSATFPGIAAAAARQWGDYVRANP